MDPKPMSLGKSEDHEVNRAPFVCRWNRIQQFVPGMYAVRMTGELSEEMVELCDTHKQDVKPTIEYDGNKKHNA